MSLEVYLIVCITIQQDRTPFVEPSTTIHHDMPSNDGGGLGTDRNGDLGAGRTIIRVRIGHGVRVSLSPLVVPAVALLFKDLVVNVSQKLFDRRTSSQVIPAS